MHKKLRSFQTKNKYNVFLVTFRDLLGWHLHWLCIVAPPVNTFQNCSYNEDHYILLSFSPQEVNFSGELGICFINTTLESLSFST